MKRISSLLIIVLLLLSMMTLTACSSDDAMVESVMEIDSDFSGHREITIKYPLDASIDSLLLELNEKNPLAEYKDSTFEYVGVEQDGYTFIMDIVFDSRDEYIEQIKKLVGREVTSSVSLPDSVLCSGVRMKEDFDVADIISWMTKLSENNEDTEDIEYDYSVNTVRIDDAVFNTESTVDISEREGMPLDSIIIETTNLKDSTYDRTITFLVPNNTYNKLSDSLQTYFLSITEADASYADWTSKGTCWEYKVIYKGLDIEELSERTGLLLDTVSNNTYYGDKNNSSTPLSEGLIFEESFNTFSYINEDGEDVPVTYKYALPTKTTYGEGSVFIDGKWKTDGEWTDGEYSVTAESDIVKIRIPDGIQYSINGIDIKLNVMGEDDFVRTTDFLYSKKDSDGLVYAKDFFENKGAVVTVAKEADNYICR
ncbi:MAG: hypothetical protein Q4A12_05660, partial [Eubacteriales bacterium]|nr:hypothetical protein [Eubacteriales bacterium]